MTPTSTEQHYSHLVDTSKIEVPQRPTLFTLTHKTALLDLCGGGGGVW